MYREPITPAHIDRLARALGSIFHQYEGLFDQLMERKRDAREAALMDVNEFIFSNASPLTIGDRVAIIEIATEMAERAKVKVEGNVIRIPRIRFEKPKD